jgi:hypothetical protein
LCFSIEVKKIVKKSSEGLTLKYLQQISIASRLRELEIPILKEGRSPSSPGRPLK